MKSISLRILAIVLSLMWFALSSAHVGRNGSTGANVRIDGELDQAVLGREFKIKYGQELRVKGQNLIVKFESMLEDSRCPADVKCVWAGDAKILVSVKRTNAKESKIELHTSGQFAQTGKYRQYVIKLIRLDPYPRTSVKEKRSDYVATLLVTKE